MVFCSMVKERAEKTAVLCICCLTQGTTRCRFGVFTRQVTRGERGQGALASSLAEESLHSIGLVKVHGYEVSEKIRFQKQLQVLAELSYLKMVGYAVGPSTAQYTCDQIHATNPYAATTRLLVSSFFYCRSVNSIY